MISVANDPSLKWAETCDLLRSRIAGLPTAAGCFIFPSVEAALIEVAVLLADRDRETGGGKNAIVYGVLQDPSLDLMAKAMSSTGLEAKPKTEADWLQAETWLPELKSKTLLIAQAEDDRFTGRVYDSAARRATFFKDGMRVPVISLCFESARCGTLPRPFEIRIYPLANAAIAIVGERLRLEPRMAPVSMDPFRLAQIQESLAADSFFSAIAPDALSFESAKARTEIESFESALPAGFQAWWPAGALRMLDRAVITSKDHDGSNVVETLRGNLKKVSPAILDRGLFALSGCAMNDERRQEWLRLRGDDAWLIRGAIHISRELLRTASSEVVLGALTKLK